MSLVWTVMCCAALSGEGDPLDLPRSLSAMTEPVREEARMMWTLGPRIGYADAKDADNGTWMVGIQSRLHIFSWLAVEGSVDYRKDEFENGDIESVSIPIQFSGIVFLPVDWSFRPYGLVGFGWYVTETKFSGAFAAQKDESDTDFGGHAGLGVDFKLNESLTLDVDFRFIWRNEPPKVASNYDFYQITAGLNFKLGGGK
jgi:opacity protein-like surface antigen